MTPHPKTRATGIVLGLALALAGCTADEVEPAGDFSFDHFREVEVGADWADASLTLGPNIKGGGSCGNFGWDVEADDDFKWFVMVNVSHPYADGETDFSTGIVESFSISGMLSEEMAEAWAYNEPGFVIDGAYWSDAPTTGQGIRIGSTADDVYRAYPDAALMDPDEPALGEPGESRIRATDGSGNAMDFTLLDDVVLEIQAGPIAVLDAPPEPCD